jgi:hypothetical protein
MANPSDPDHKPPTVFLSYASQDRLAAQAIRDALPACGFEVWYDESDLNGGDAWDQKIRRQIRECDFFMPVISAQTEARSEGYFRREWRLAVERALDMADDHIFLLPVVIDDTSQAGARVPERFLGIQWLKLPGGHPTPAMAALCRRLLAGETVVPATVKRTPGTTRAIPQPPARDFPPFPHEEPGQKMRFWALAAGWAFQSAWIFFNRWPKWLRVFIYIWVGIAVVAKGCTPDQHTAKTPDPDIKKLQQIANAYHGSLNKGDVAKLGKQIAQAFSDEADGDAPAESPVLAIPFGAPAGDLAAQNLADASFAQMYGKVAISHHGQVALADGPLAALDPAAAAEQGRAHQAKFVICGAVDNQATPPNLVLKIVRVSDAAVVWSDAQPVASADAAKIAADVNAKMQSLEDD